MSATENCESVVQPDGSVPGPRAIGQLLELAEQDLVAAEEKFGRQSIELLPTLDKLAQLYFCDGLFAKAELIYRRAVDIVTSAGAPDGKAVDVLFKLGALYRTERKFDDAEAVYLRAMGLAEKQADSTDNKRAYAERLCYLAGLYYEKHEFGQCEQLLTKASSIFNEVFGDNNYFSRLCWLGLAACCRKSGKSGEAEEHLARAAYAQPQAANTGERNPHSDERAIIELTKQYFAQSRWNEVDQLLLPVLFSEEEKLWPLSPRVAGFLHDRGELFRAQAQYEQAQKWLQIAFDRRLQALGNAHPEVAMSAMCLGIMLLAQNRYTDAEPILKQALATRVRAFGVEHSSVAACIETYSVLLKRTKRHPIAQKLDARARDIRTKLVWLSERNTAVPRTPYPNS
jgi:tetratricopeptide (TPR) repeat protein